MIEEELKQEAEKSLDKRLGTYAYIRKQDCYTNYVDGYIDGAEPREKRIEELEKDKQYFSDSLDKQIEATLKLDKQNAELRKIAEFQQSSNMNTHFENKKLKEGLAVGSTWNKHLNSLNKALEEERDKYRNMVFDKDEQLTKAKDHIKKLLDCLKQDTNDQQTNYYVCQYMDKAEQFLSEVEK
jgi:hypothetical protein